MKKRTPALEPITGAQDCTIDLDLSRHCIQTAVRRRYEKLLAAYFKAETGRSTLETQIGLLQQALESLDFAVLRSHWPILAGGRSITVCLGLAAGRILIETEGLSIQAPLRETAATGSTMGTNR